MSSKYKFGDQDKLYIVSFTIVYLIDLFIRKEYKNILLESWKYCKEEKGMELYGWCIMSSHVHMIIGTHKEKMQDIMRDMKKYTSAKLKKQSRDTMEKVAEIGCYGNIKGTSCQSGDALNHGLHLTIPIEHSRQAENKQTVFITYNTLRKNRK